MRKKLVSAAVAVALMVTTLAPAAKAGEANQIATNASMVGLRSSIERSASRLAADESHARLLPRAYRESETEMTQGSSGGGGHTGMIVMMLVSTAASIGGGYLIYKEMKKQTSQASK